MYLTSLRLRDFRNYERADLECSSGIHVLHGDNGQGKTSVLEAVYYLCLTRSFKTQDDELAVRFGQPFFDIEGRFEREEHEHPVPEASVRVIVHRGEGKSVLVDRSRLDRFSELIGRFPAVISSPEDVQIVSGAPGLRRRWIDMALSQQDPLYLRDLQMYRQSLRQRNAVLAQDHVRPDTLAAWDEPLIQSGSRIVRKRVEFIRTFSPLAADVYGHMAPDDERIEVLYRSTVSEEGAVDAGRSFEESFRSLLQRHRQKEIERRSSLFGPHKDELVFHLCGRSMREFGSQGQHKTLALALKLAEFLYMSDRRGWTPLLLLDDVFSELDPARRRHLVRYLERAGQVFLTTTEPLIALDTNRSIRHVRIENGKLEEPMAAEVG